LGFFIPLVIIAWGPFQKARQVAQRNACGENLQAIVVAKAKWAEEKGKTDVPNEKDLRPYLPSKFSKCPAGGDYTINFTNKAPTCSVADHRLPKH
jgi:hypothetical protein